jgi:serine/threonine protein kinase/uncharacterized membrane protein YccF (DUF307 family)
MSCPEREIIESYILGSLNTAELAKFKKHLGICQICSIRVKEAQENEKALTEPRTLGDKGKTTPTETADDALTTGHVQSLLGKRYRVIRRIGGASASHVFQAVDTVLERLVAVKFLPHQSDSKESADGSWREARLMSHFNHPNIAQIYEIGELEDRRFIIVEWVDGLPITEAWKDLDLEQRLELYIKVVDAVSVAHKRGIIHRDLKPSNILVTSDLKPKVLDFGIALETSCLGNLETGVYRGTPAYSAPEQISRPVKLHSATDVFALGVLLYQLLTDTLPFPQSQTDKLFEAIRNQHPELPTAISKNTPVPLQNICLKALEKEPEKRYASAQELSSDLTHYLRGERVWSRPSFLMDQMQQEILYHRQKLDVWYDNELITQEEYDKLEVIYDHITSTSDLSIIEARTLSFSQVCLYLGGWIVVLGSFVLFYKSWQDIPVYCRPLPAIAATLLVMILGDAFWRRQESKLAIGFLATANLLIPITVLLTLGQWEIFSSTHYPFGTETVSTGLRNLSSDIVVGNVQLLISFIWWFVFSGIVFWRTKSSPFILAGVLAFLGSLSTCYIAASMEHWQADFICSMYLAPGAALFVVGLVLDRRWYTEYAWPMSFVGLVLIVVSLSGIALSNNTLFGWLWVKPQFLNETEYHFLSFLCNGIFYLGLAGMCRLLGTPLQRSLANALNWLGPIHILIALRILDLDYADLPDLHRWIYRFLLPIFSLSLVFGSVLHQMKSFFYTGLGGIAASVHKFTIKHLDKFFAWPVSLILTGILWMLMAWLIPRWKNNLASRQEKRPSF